MQVELNISELHTICNSLLKKIEQGDKVNGDIEVATRTHEKLRAILHQAEQEQLFEWLSTLKRINSYETK